MPRGDGRLNHDLLPDDKGPQDACGVFGVWAPGEEVANLTYFGLYALQHRGQESAGIAVSDGKKILVYKDMGLVSQVFNESNLASLRGDIAVGHARYSTSGSSVWENAQPTFRSTAMGGIALVHNGNLTNTGDLAQLVEKAQATSGEIAFAQRPLRSTSDTDLVTALLASHPDRSLETAAIEVLQQVEGAFSFVFMDESTLYAARDRYGVRPLALGKLERGWVVASETAALDIVGASYVREIEPGELLAIDENGPRSVRFAEPDPKFCVFEFVYLARPDSSLDGRNVHTTRLELGRQLAREAPVDADLVMPTPDSGTPAAIGYAEASGIPYAAGLVKNAYVGRTFIQPSQTLRQLGIRLKLNPLRDVIRGKRIIVVDDSIVRGNTQRAVVRMLREAGATQVHVRISSPPVKWPCFYGIDFATRAELIANGLGVEEIRTSLGADSLAYVSLDGLVAATGRSKDNLCRACFDGEYPTVLPDPSLQGKHMLEITPVAHLLTTVPSVGGETALEHP
ncbi:MAG: amidophosphoribosyltransferase [Actinomycetota bacterium]|nr:amidophosphoribosyltransferase [Actinomycetota bacterium]